MVSMLTREYPIPREIVEVEPKYPKYVPYFGDYSVRGYTGRRTVDERLAVIWHNMMRKCYHTPDPAYRKYGAKGAFVCAGWHNLEVFLQEVKEIPHWAFKLANFDGFCLDSDHYDSNCYSRETCVWVTNSENAVYREQAHPVVATHLLTRQARLFLSVAACARAYEISDSKLCGFISGEKQVQPYSKVAGHKFELLDSNKLLRYKLLGEQNV